METHCIKNYTFFERGKHIFPTHADTLIEVGADLVTKSLEVLAILAYHPVVRENMINIDLGIFVKLFKKYVVARDGRNRDLLLEIFSSIVKQERDLLNIFDDNFMIIYRHNNFYEYKIIRSSFLS